MESPKVKFSIQNNTNTIVEQNNGIAFVIGQSLRGPYNKPSEIINTWPQFIKQFGGLIDSSDAPLKVKELLENGVKIRFVKVGHYTTIDDASTLTAVKAQPADDIIDSDELELFELLLKNPGLDGNNIQVHITNGSNGITGYFDINITHTVEESIAESYTNLKIIGKPTAADSNYLKEITDNSLFVNVLYKDLSGSTSSNIYPEPITIDFEGGTNGGSIVDTDYVGSSSSLTGLNAFDPYDDSMVLGVLDNSTDVVHIAASAYAAKRMDLIYVLGLPKTIKTESAITTKRSTYAIDSKYTYIIGGVLGTLNPLNNQTVEITSEVDTIISAIKTAKEFGPWYSFSGNNRGIVRNRLYVEPNYGTPASVGTLDNLANRQVSMIINKGGAIKIWGNYSAQSKQNAESQINVVMLMIFLKKSLAPFLENYLDEPNDFTTWRNIYYSVKPFLDSVVTRRALSTYTWEGDQFANSDNDLVVNTAAEKQQGKYKVKLFVTPISSINTIEVVINISPAGVSFETINSI